MAYVHGHIRLRESVETDSPRRTAPLCSDLARVPDGATVGERCSDLAASSRPERLRGPRGGRVAPASEPRSCQTQSRDPGWCRALARRSARAKHR